jgi:hypothetical protein
VKIPAQEAGDVPLCFGISITGPSAARFRIAMRAIGPHQLIFGYMAGLQQRGILISVRGVVEGLVMVPL